MLRVILTLSIFISMGYSQLYEGFDIPTFQFKNANVSGSPLFSSISSGEGSSTIINAGGRYTFSSQSPEFTYSYGGELAYGSQTITVLGNEESFEDETTKSGEYALNAPFSVNKYFGDSKGAYAFADGNLDYHGGKDWENIDDTGDLNLTVGGGYGRIISAKPVAQAAAIASELGGGISDEGILEMAAIISKASSGYYINLYKDDAQIEYYNALEVASGKTGVTMKIMQIMTSPVFNISDRHVGWFARAGLTDNYMKAEGDETKSSLSLEAGYAKPMGMDKQLTASFEYDKNMAEFGGSEMLLGATGTMDHSYTWVSGASINLGSLSVKHPEFYLNEKQEMISESIFALNIYSTRAIVNKLVATASLDFMKTGEADPVSELKLEFTYFIF